MIMNGLPFHLLDDILSRLEPISLAVLRCTDKFFQSYIFDWNRFFRVGSGFFHIWSYGAHSICFLPLASSCVSMSTGKSTHIRKRSYIFGSCSGLLLLYTDGLFVANPLTKKFRLLDHSGSKLLHEIVGGDGDLMRNRREGNIAHTERAMCIGFAVERIQNRATKRFKIVGILEMQTEEYGFEISDGDSWRSSERTISTSTKSELTTRMKPVYLNETLHWLRNDGSIIGFNPETEQASFIPSIFHREPEMKLFFASDDNTNLLTIISRKKETISVYTLVENTKWALTKRIKNEFMEESELQPWKVVAYDGKHLVVWETKKYVIHVYDMEANSWGVMGSTEKWVSSNRDFYKFNPSLFFVDEDEHKKMILASNDLRISYQTAVMGLIDTTQ